jgi:uncharacterized damage-inducible protein DinB
MDLQTHRMNWDQMRLRHGITLRLLEQFTPEQLASHPIAGMRTPIELVVHVYSGLRALSQTVLTGALPKTDEKTEAAAVRTQEQLLAYVKAAWADGDRNAHAATEAQLNATIHTPWGSFPGHVMFGFFYEEYLHHRGQLYAFLRTFGVEPVMIWDYEHSAPEFQPREAAQG